MKRMSDGKQQDIIPAIQTLINCGSAGSCNGGDSHAAYAWTYKNGGVPDVTCQQYQAKNMECTAMNTCQDCSHDPSVGCFAKEDYPIVTISEFGGVKGEENIMNELYQRGPVAAYIDATCIEGEPTNGVYMYDDCRRMTNHAVQIAGWGVSNSSGSPVPYWLARNSWGRYYNEDGWFKVVRGGRYDAGTVYWAVPEMSESSNNKGTYKKN
jgi:cathepsin X